MALTTREALKIAFGVQKQPSAADFENLIDSIRGRQATVVIAANDAPAAVKNYADYICDGVNDQAEINTALGLLPSAGGMVLLSQGTFNLAYTGIASGTALNVPYCVLVNNSMGNVQLVGTGAGLTKLRLVDSQPSSTVLLCIRGADGTSGRRTNPTLVRGIEFDGNAPMQTSTDFGQIQLAYANLVTLDDVFVHNHHHFGVHVLRDSQYFRALNSRFQTKDLYDAGLRLESPNAMVQGCWFFGETNQSMTLLVAVANQDIGVQSVDLSVQNNHFSKAKTQVVFNTRRAKFFGNTFTGCDYASGSWNLTLQAVTGYHIEDVIISNNNFYEVRQGIHLACSGSGEIRRTIIANNILTEGGTIGQATGMSLDTAAVKNTQILYNIIYSATTPIYNGGTDTVMVGNVEL